MALDLSTLEWLRRLSDEPEPSDVATLQALRRGAREPGDVRLLDSLLSGVAERDRANRERRELESRLAYLESQAGTEARARNARHRELAVKQLARALSRSERLSQADADRRARAAVERGALEEEQQRGTELATIKVRLRELARTS